MEKEATMKRPKMIKKSRKSESGSPKIEKKGDRGCLEATRERGIGKKCRFCLPVVSLFVDFGGKWEPRWQPKSIKNRSKSIRKKYIFLINLKLRFDTELGAKMDKKSIQKRCQKRVGNDLAVNLKKSEKMTPL